MCPKPNTYIYIMSMSISCSMLCVSLVTIQMGRRESLFGRVPPVVEVPSVKQRRNSLSIPFFSHPTPKQGEGPKLLDDNLPVSLVVMVMHATLTTICQLHCIRLSISYMQYMENISCISAFFSNIYYFQWPPRVIYLSTF